MLPKQYYATFADYVETMKGFIQRGLLGVELKFETPGQATELDGKKVTSFASNDYLSLIQDPRVMEAGSKAALKYGTGAGSSMLGSGSLRIHRQLEEELAAYLEKDACMLFPTGYSAMLGYASFNIINGSKIYSDSLNHRSMLDGMALGIGSIPDRSNQYHYFKHNSLEHLKMVHKLQHRPERYDTLFIEGVYSMDGDQGDLRTLVPYATSANMAVAVDDAHGLGVLGRNGRGAPDAHGVTKETDFILGTFSKSFATTGGFAVGDRDSILYMKANCSVYMFSASIIPVNVETVRFILKLLLKDDSLQKKLWENINYLKKSLKEASFDYGISDSAVVPVILNDTEKAFYFSKRLLDLGVFVVAVCFPVVKRGQERLRISVNAGHSSKDIDNLVGGLVKIRKEWEDAGNKIPASFQPNVQVHDMAPSTNGKSPSVGGANGNSKVFEVVKSKVIEILPDVKAADITPDKSLKDLGANSVDRVEVAM
ncbi:MAG: aminotransferase class I/II-fold pyridoxal phosphate-dependent enzyme, partial [Spirochaetia bacterium]|nr:aminotransferase class I/II-fold pyridoxal phosphate-dependent enzyme [Spirochaetia bacterium]